MKYLKLFELFGGFQLDEITRKQYIDIQVNREDEIINYGSLQLMGENLDKKYELKHTGVWFKIEWVDILNGNVEIQTEIFVDKVSQYGDEPFYTLKYYYELSKGSKYSDRHHFFSFEESDFDQMCKNPQILIDYLKDNYFDETIIQRDGAVDEAFGFSRGINPEILTREQFESLSRQSIHMRFSSKTTVGLTMNVRKTDININYDSKVKQHIMFYFNYSYLDAKMVFNTKFSIMKTEGDEPFVYFQSGYGYRNIGTDYWEYQKYPQDESIYGRMEVEEFDQIIKNPRLWKNWMVDKCYEIDQQTHKILKESLFDVPDPELMDDNEWDEEVTYAKEVDFAQKEKELFISLSQTIPPKHRIEDVGDSHLSFSIMNGVDGIYPNLRSTTVIRSITSYKNDDEYYYVNVWEGNDSDGVHKSYRCDGYECWEKFLKEIFQGYRDLISKGNKTNESFGDVPEPQRLIGDQWDEELDKIVEGKFDQADINLLVSLSDSIPNEWKKKKTIFNYFEFHFGRHGISGLVWLCKTDDDYYLVEVWDRIKNINTDSQLYKCDGFECMEKLLRKTFDDFREIISRSTKTNESIFDEVPEPRSLLDENGDYIEGSSRLRMNNREPFNQKEKLFINQLLETLNEEYVSTNFSDSSEFVLNMGEMGETTHGMRVVKMEDEYYEVQYNNFVDSDDEYIYFECDGFECLSILLRRLFGKIRDDYSYEE